MGIRRLTVALVTLAALVIPSIRLAPAAAVASALCGKNNLPETGIQGSVPKRDQLNGRAEKGYNCGLSVVGHAVLNAQGRAPDANANMAWSQHCAYIAGPGSVTPGLRGAPRTWQGVAVVDVSDPTKPKHVRTLMGGRATELAIETITAIDSGNRHILAVGEYGNVTGGQNKLMNIYDVTDCTKPRLLQAFEFPFNIHNLTISGNGRYLFATQPLQVVDLDPLFKGRAATYVGNLDAVTPSPLVGVPELAATGLVPTIPRSLYLSHEAAPSFDGTRLYLGGQTPQFQTFTILDIKDWLKNPVANKPKVISQVPGRGHSIRQATIKGHRYLLRSEESVFGGAYGCVPEVMAPFGGVAEPYLMNIDDETRPRDVSRIRLDINRPANCPTQLANGENDSVHYHDLNDATDTRFAMLSMWNAGLRIVDVRDPVHPKEVAYFNPADVAAGTKLALDVAWSHVRYDPVRGQIWLSTARGGFWVLQLEPQLLKYFGLSAPKASSLPAGGRPGKAGYATPQRTKFDSNATTVAGYYCTVGSPLAALVPSKP